MDSMYTQEEMNDFYKNYRENLSRQNQISTQLLDQQRKNSFAQMMGAANKSGMMYSNFPTREKIKYDQNTYQPAQVKAYTTYQTGLDQLRNNILNNWNSITNLKEAIAHLNSMK